MSAQTTHSSHSSRAAAARFARPYLAPLLRFLLCASVCAWPRAAHAQRDAGPRNVAEGGERSGEHFGERGGLRLRVRGTARISAHASRQDGELVLSGALADDVGAPLGGQALHVRISQDAGTRGPSNDPDAETRAALLADGLRTARACEPTPPLAVHLSGTATTPELLVTTDDAGRFCVRAKIPHVRHTAHFSWRGTDLLEGVEHDDSFDLSRRPLVLRFDPPPRVVWLDQPRATFDVAAIADDEGVSRAVVGSPLTLANANANASDGGELGTATTDASGHARFEVDSARLGPPGRGTLRVSFPGDADVAFASQSVDVERRTRVVLRAPAASRGDLEAKNPEDGIPLLVEVESAVGPVSEGGVEATVGDVVVGAAPVERGRARLTLTFAALGPEALVHLRYVPQSPWYEPFRDPTVRIPIRGPGLLAKVPLLLAGLVVFALFVIGRLASQAARPEPAKKRESDPHLGKPRIDVIRTAAKGETGWRGHVADADDGARIAGARVYIERGTFEGRLVLASATTDETGAFALPAMGQIVGGERLVSESPLHARLVQPLPAEGELAIALVLRRRALLARLVAWARRAGPPYDVKPEPTPGHVQRAAGDDLRTARWAEAVERAAFGEGAVDEQLEREVDALRAAAGASSAPAPGGGPERS